MGLVIAGGSSSRAYVIDAYAGGYGLKADGTTDDTAALQAALNAGVVDVAGVSGNDDAARIVQLPPGQIIVQGTVTIPANVHLRGHGASGTYLKRQAGGTGTTVIATTGVQHLLSDFGVICNDYLVDCITITGGGASILSDARQVLRDIVVVGGRDGFSGHSTNANEIRLHNCAAYRTARHGFSFNTTDGFMEGCTSAAAGTGAHAEYTGSSIFGFLMAGNNWRLYGCKAFGQLGPFGGGFSIADRNQVTCCEAQDCQMNGFTIVANYGYTVVSSCLSDSNGKYGFEITGDASVVGCQSMVRGGGLYTTTEAIRVQPVTGVGPKVRAFSQTACTRLYINDATRLVGATLDLMNRYGAQSPAYAATVTPDPWLGQDVYVGTLTGGITIANPSTAPAAPALLTRSG
jgi:hypothetical protein